MKIGLNFGFLKFETDVNFTDRQRENWASLLSDLTDYRVLRSAMEAEYAGEVFSAVVRLRDNALPGAIKDLKADDPLRGSYDRMRRALRDFLVAVRNIGRDTLSNKDLKLADIKPIGYQWVFVSALERMRGAFLREIQDNCLLFGLTLPGEFASEYRPPENIAEEWAQEVAPSPNQLSRKQEPA